MLLFMSSKREPIRWCSSQKSTSSRKSRGRVVSDQASLRSTAERNPLMSWTPVAFKKRSICSSWMSSNVTKRNDVSGSVLSVTICITSTKPSVVLEDARRATGPKAKAFSQIARSVFARHAVLRPVMIMCARVKAFWVNRPSFRIARSKSFGSFNRASSTESMRSQPSASEESQLSNSSNVPTSKASSKSEVTFSIRRKKERKKFWLDSGAGKRRFGSQQFYLIPPRTAVSPDYELASQAIGALPAGYAYRLGRHRQTHQHQKGFWRKCGQGQ